MQALNERAPWLVFRQAHSVLRQALRVEPLTTEIHQAALDSLIVDAALGGARARSF